jgi:hypothetical protein
VQVDLLFERLNLGEYPFPLEFRSYGETHEERAVLWQRVQDELHASGLMRRGRLDPELEQALRIVLRPQRSLDALWIPDERTGSPFRAVAADAGNVAVLAVAQPGPEPNFGGQLRLEMIHPTRVVDAVLGALPQASPGRHPPLSVSFSELHPPASDQARHASSDESLGGVLVSAATTPHGASRNNQLFMDIVDQRHCAGGQFACNSRSRAGSVTRSPAIRWFDNEQGAERYVVFPDGGQGDGQRFTVMPGDPARVAAKLNEMLASLTQQY